MAGVGHILDVALESNESDVRTLLQHCFGSQVGYLRGGLIPNAMAVHRRVEDDLPDVAIEDVDTACLALGCSFLRFDWSLLRSLLDNVEGQLRARAPQGDATTLSGTALGPVVELARACRALMRYLVNGERDALDEADASLRAAVSPGPAADGYLDARWVAAHLRSIAGDLPQASVWDALPPDVPTAVKRAFTMGQPAVSLLWQPQLEAVGTSSGTSALDASVKRVVLSVPTSSGKTLISQLFTLHHLSSGVGGVCFVVPTRSLAREVRRDFKVRLRLYGRTVAQERADWDLDHAQVDDAVEVMTPERLVHLLRNDVPGVLARFGLFIFDEAHSAGEGDRGFTVESAISLLHALTTSTHHRIILMSAALGNQSQIALWVDPNSTGRTAVSDWRGPRRLHAIFNTDIDWNQTPKTSMTKSRAWPNLVTYDVHGLVRLRHTSGSHTGLRTSQPLGQLSFRTDSSGEYERNPETGRRKRYEARSTSNYVMLLEIITLVAEAGPVLVIRSTREQTRQLAVQLAQTLEPSSDASDLAQFASTRLGSAHPLAEVLAKGVAYHHSGLPADVLDLIEDGVRGGRIKYVVATTGIADGVNLPVRTVFIDEPGNHAWARPLSPAQVINAVGRAGRSCIESEGWAILVPTRKPSESDFARLAPDADELRVLSRLATQEALDALAEFEVLQRESADAIFNASNDEVSAFISFAWLVLNANEELGTLNADVNLTSAFASTLAWTQLNDSLKSRWLALSASIASLLRRDRSGPTPTLGSDLHVGRHSTDCRVAVSDVVAAAIATEANLGDPANRLPTGVRRRLEPNPRSSRS